MRIESIEIGICEVPLVTPFKTALRSVETLESILVKISTKSGYIGYGETVPTVAITGESKESILSALGQIGRAITGLDIGDFTQCTDVVAETMRGNTSAKAAIEIALYDLRAQYAGLPLYRYLGGSQTSFKTGLTISLNPIEEMVRDATKAVALGFDSLKIKLGDDYTEDILRIEAIGRAVGKHASLKLDANQGWSPEESVAFLDKILERGIHVELIEQPVTKSDWAGLKYIKERTTVPILADESVFSPEDARAILQMKACDLINIKLDKCGGITKALEIADICNEYGIACMIGCMMEGAVSVGAAAHVASARPDTITMFDLDAPMLCQYSPVVGGAAFSGADILLRHEAGLAIKDILEIPWKRHP